MSRASEGGAGSERAQLGDLWAALHREICRNWRRRVRPPLDVEDIASEVVCRAFGQFGELGLPWLQLRAWGLRTANRLVVDHVRRLRLARLNQEVDVDSIPAPRAGGAEVARVHRRFHRLADEQWLELAPLLPVRLPELIAPGNG